MDWPTVVVNFITSGVSVSAVAFLFNRSIERQRTRFSIGATSHMATVAFDKHIGFCEEYIKAASYALEAFQDGPKEKPLDTRDLLRIRQKWALWLTPEIESKLDRFEHKMTQIGGEAQVYGPGDFSSVIADLRFVLGIQELTVLRGELVAGSAKKSPRAT